jgi:hypothetical protein
MNRITVDNSLKAQLDAISEPVEVVDESGRTLGHFLPALPMGASDRCPYSATDIERLRREEGGRPLAEIWKSLGVK